MISRINASNAGTIAAQLRQFSSQAEVIKAQLEILGMEK
jgi:hypothetical protein